MGPRASAATLAEGQAAYTQNRIADARAAFSALLDSPTVPAPERAAAGIELARIAFLVDARPEQALKLLERALATGGSPCQSATMSARVLRESGHPERVLARAAEWEDACHAPVDLDALLLEHARAQLDVLARAHKRSAPTEVAQTLARLSPAQHVSLEANRLRLEVALLDSSAQAALAAWRAYFWLTEHNAPPGFGWSDADIAGRFEAALSPQPSVAQETALLELLVRAGFDREARRFDHVRRVGVRAAKTPAYRRVATYFRLRDALTAAALVYNRAEARGGQGHGDAEAYERTVTQALRLATLTLPGSTEPHAALREAYGLYWALGDTEGYRSLHMGHVVQEEERVIQQCARSHRIRFLVLDNMIANGFTGWLWDGLRGPGGWAETGSVILQVRERYVPSVLRALDKLEGRPGRQRLLEQAADPQQADAAALARQPVAYLPGLAARLELQTLDALAARVRAQAPADFDQAFTATAWRLSVDRSIFLHEGRHVLDQAQFPPPHELAASELEFRAKLSELQFAELPRDAFAAINMANLGLQTPHGEANTRILEGLRHWMERHAAELPHYDRSRPALLQLDTLTDEQLRAAARELDPAGCTPPREG